MDVRFSMTPIEGPATAEFPEDYRIDITFLNKGEVVFDASGENALLVSEVLASLPAEELAEIVRDRAIELVKRARGIA